MSSNQFDRYGNPILTGPYNTVYDVTSVPFRQRPSMTFHGATVTDNDTDNTTDVTVGVGGNIADQTLLGNTSGSSAPPSAQSALTVAEMLGSELPTVGSNLGNASVSIDITQGANRVMPSGTLTANRTITLATTGSPITGEIIQVRRRDSSAFTLTFQDDALTSLLVMPVSTKMLATFRFDGTHYTLFGAIRIQ